MSDDHIKGQLATGEVLLIDTRQHWIAALRYAFRPLLIIGLAALLALVNQWLRFDRLGFINDIVHWIILIALIVAIVWLPIDLVRWWSRHYVLTNRRSMRMEGVLRKQSRDSSLEQINDIMLSQSFLGRQLGYADLTLLTANAASDAYEQLLDGPQFKKAVLDAKEAIRSGHPLQALPEGFVVKGGTNDASLRASRKSADDAAAAGSAATATVVTTAAATMGFEEERREAAPPAAADEVPEWPEPVATDAPAAEPATVKTSIVAPDEPAAADSASMGSGGGADVSGVGSGTASAGDGGASADGGSTTT